MRGSIPKEPTELEVGQRVYLYPNTKQASFNVHRQLAAVVEKDPKAHWPRVLVAWKEGDEDRWELVHRDNISVKPIAPPKSKDKEHGDAVGSSDGGPAKVRVLGSPIKQIDPDLGEQGVLF